MNLENQVCTLENASKLSALGITQNSSFYWAINSYNQECKEITMQPDNRDIVFSAFTSVELSEMIKSGSADAERLWNRMLSRLNGGNSCVSFYKPDFLAEFLIDILNAKYVSSETCNKRRVAEGSI
jgi:hypothetical protein